MTISEIACKPGMEYAKHGNFERLAKEARTVMPGLLPLLPSER